MPNETTETNLVAAASHNFRIYRGDSWSCVLTFFDTDGSPLNLAGSAIKLQVKAKATDTNTVKELSLGTGLTLSGSGNNILTIESAGDLPVRVGDYAYDLQVTFGSGRIVTYLRGTVVVVQDVTR